jgi:hypothetical protein
MGCQDQDQEISSYSFTKREISENHSLKLKKPQNRYVDKANRILPLRRIIKIKLREGTILIY